MMAKRRCPRGACIVTDVTQAGARSRLSLGVYWHSKACTYSISYFILVFQLFMSFQYFCFSVFQQFFPLLAYKEDNAVCVSVDILLFVENIFFYAYLISNSLFVLCT